MTRNPTHNHWDLSYESASCVLSERESGVWVTGLYSTKPRKGHATGLMQKVIDFADERGLGLILVARQFGSTTGLNDSDLITFYEKFGFKVHTGKIMIRQPQNLHSV